MSYFSKDVYDRKREWAYGRTAESLEEIAFSIIKDNPVFQEYNLEDKEWYLKLDEESIERIDSEIEGLVEELRPIAELSHKRHEIHSTDRSDFVNGNTEILSEVGNQYSDECLIDEVNGLNKKYRLVSDSVPLIDDVEVCLDTDDVSDILDYFGETPSEDDDEDYQKATDLLYDEWDKVINRWSDKVRKWYEKLNARFGTGFPD